MSSPSKKRPQESSIATDSADAANAAIAASSADDDWLQAEGQRLQATTAQGRLDRRLIESTSRRLSQAEMEIEREYKKQKTKLHGEWSELNKQRRAIQSADQQLRFDRLCFKLRSSRSRDVKSNQNAVSTTTHTISINNLSILYKGHAKPLGEALLRSTNVTSLTIVPDMLLPLSEKRDEATTATSTATSTSTPDFTNTIETTDRAKALEALVCYVKGSTTLQRVRFENANEYWYSSAKTSEFLADERIAINLFLPAIQANDSIHSVDLGRMPLQPHVLSSFLSAKTNLTCLYVDVAKLDGLSSGAGLPTAIKGLVALERLTLSGILHDFRLVISMLRQLTPNIPRLQELDLRGGAPKFPRSSNPNRNFWKDCSSVLVQILHSSTTLQHLALSDFHISGDNMKKLLAGLHNSADGTTRSSTTISKLTLNCCLDYYATDAFDKFLQTELYHNNDSASSWQHVTSLRELNGLGGHKIPAIVSGYNSTNNTVGSATIGSQLLHTVSFSGMPEDCANEFIRLSSGIRHLHCLHLADMCESHCRDLARCLAHLPTLHELRLTNVSNDRRTQTAKVLLRMLRENDSIFTFSAHTDVKKQHPRLFSKKQLRRVKAYAQRNRFLMQLVQKQFKKTDSDFSTAQSFQPPPVVATTRATTLDPVPHYLVVPIATRLSRDKLWGVVWAMEHPRVLDDSRSID